MSQIIFLHEIYETRRQKKMELDYYKSQMDLLIQRMELTQKEIIVTDNIIHIIENELKK